ncbi:MAG: HAD family hydrolase [Candidatus Nanosalina sp.]
MSKEKIPVFDVGDTLTPARQFSRRFFREELVRQGIEDPPEYPFDGYNEYVVDSIQQWLVEEGIDADAEKMVRHYLDKKEKDMEERRVFETLRKVNENFETLGILSDNRMAAREWFIEIFDKHGVEFDTFLVSEEIGVKKPDRKIFQEFLDRRGVGGERCVYFGNRGDIDSACQKVGINFVWVTEHDTFGTDWADVKIDELKYGHVERAMEEVETV